MKKRKDDHSGLQETDVCTWGIICPTYLREIQPKILPSERYIGQGVSGIIYQTTWFGKRYVRKDFPGVQSYLFQLEADALCGFTHQNIVELVGVSFGYSCCSLVLEYVPDDLHNVVQKRKFAGWTPPFKRHEWIGIMSRIANAMRYSHEQAVAHGDLKPNNVLMSDPKTGQMIVKVVDFGFTETKRRIRLVSKRLRHLETLMWKSPELVLKLLGSSSEGLDDPSWEYDTDSDLDDSPDSYESSETKQAQLIKGDIYSFGMVCYWMLTGNKPFSTVSSLSEVKKMVLTGNLREILELPKECPSELKTWIEKCWSREPSLRPSFGEICDVLDKLQNAALTDSENANINEIASSAVEIPRKGETLTSEYTEPEASVLSRTEEREASQKIKEDSKFDNIGISNQFRHKIFLSHSGAQKDFVEQLCKDLQGRTHFPFFDKRPVRLPKDKEFHCLIKEAAKRCQVAVFVLSDDFFTRRWPMIELAEFVKAQKSINTHLKILPVFLGITMGQLKDGKRLDRLLQIWHCMALEDERIDVKEWKHALSTVCGINAQHYVVGEGHMGFRKKVVAEICEMIPPDMKWDMSHLQSMERLCEPIFQKLKDVRPVHEYGVHVVGLYGMGGVGKTTISKIVCNQMFRYFDGKVCYVELGGMNIIQLRKKVLQELTDSIPTILSDSLIELAYLLEKRMRWQKVFLVLDNVWDHQIEEALMYLRAGYHIDSVVLVVSRSLDILQLLHIEICVEMPELEEEEASNLFLQQIGMSKEMCLSENDWEIVKRCIRQCSFLKLEKPGSSYGLGHTYHYHPLALKVLGSQLGRISHDTSTWKNSLERLESDRLNMLMEHPVFSVLRLGYDALQAEEQLIFMDLALFLIPKAEAYSDQNFPQSDVCEWLCMVHQKTQDEIKESVNALWRKGLLEKGTEVDEWEITIHDLYLEFAKAEVLREAPPFERGRFLIDKDRADVRHELLDYPFGSCGPFLKRLIIQNSEMRSLKKGNLSACLNVEVLQLCHCKELEEVDVTGMRGLRYMEVIGCDKLGQRIEGFEKLSNLVWLRCITDHNQRLPVPKFIHDLASLTALRVLQLKGFDWSNVGFSLPNFRLFRTLQEFPDFSDFPWVGSKPSTIPGLSDLNSLPKALSKIDFSNCSELIGIYPTSSFTNLQELNLNCCRMITDLTGLYELVSLQRLNVGHTGISALPDLGKLERLQFLDVSSCHKLTSLVCITHALTLRHVHASRCENLRELPDHFGGLERLQIVDLSWDGLICTLPNDYERLAGCDILKVEGCWGLVVPLISELQREAPERSHTVCINSIGCVSRCDQSMQSWTDARMDVSPAAYDLLKHIFPDNSCHWSYLLDDEERDDVLIRALCEHYDRGGTPRLSSTVAEVIDVDYEVSQWWAVVATAPCTFGVVTERASLEPYNMTSLHYTIVRILPEFLVHGNQAMRKHERGAWPGTWAKLGIEAVLRECKEQLHGGKREYGTYPVYSEEVRETVDTFLREIEKLNSDHPIDPIQVYDLSTVSAESAAVAKYVHPNIKREGRLDILGVKGLKDSSILMLDYDNGPRYKDTLPNFPFGPTLATQCFSWNPSSTKDVL